MDKANPPTVFGVLKPVGHTIMAFRSSQDLEAAIRALDEHGLPGSTWVRYTPEEMKALVDAELQAASPLATFGYELDLVKAYGALAESGCGFLIVHAPDKKHADIVATIARTTHAVTAQHYGIFMIEDLIDIPPGATPIA